MKYKDLEQIKIINFALGYRAGMKDTIANMQKITNKLSDDKVYEIAEQYIQEIENELCDEHKDDTH